MTAENVRASARVGKQLSLQEAQMILGVEPGATWKEISKKFDHLFKANEHNGSFYLQSKVYRAKERLEEEYRETGRMPPEEDDSSGRSEKQSAENSQDR